jgi:hypothetical protein
MELQSFALVVEIARDAIVGHWDAKVLFFATFLGRFRGFVVEQPISLHQM